MLCTSQVDLACTAGTPLGAKLASAFETCLGGEEALKPEQVELANNIQNLGLIKSKFSSPKIIMFSNTDPSILMYGHGQDILLF